MLHKYSEILTNFHSKSVSTARWNRALFSFFGKKSCFNNWILSREVSRTILSTEVHAQALIKFRFLATRCLENSIFWQALIFFPFFWKQPFLLLKSCLGVILIALGCFSLFLVFLIFRCWVHNFTLGWYRLIQADGFLTSVNKVVIIICVFQCPQELCRLDFGPWLVYPCWIGRGAETWRRTA